MKPEGPRRFRILHRWHVGKPPAEDWRVFVHFTDAKGAIKFQNDHAAARVPLVEHALLTADRRVQRSVFGEGEAVLPPFGFLAESPGFAAFHARKWNGLDYEDPPLFTLTSLDGRPLDRSGKIRVYHGFGDDRVRAAGAVRRVARESVIVPD